MADAAKKQNTAMSQASKATNPSSAQSRFREAERYARDLEAAQNERARLAQKIAQKAGEIARLEGDITQKIQRESLKQKRSEDGLRKRQEERLRRLEGVEQSHLVRLDASMSSRPHDVFISHAWDDKEGLVRDLASRCRDAGIDAFYDETSIRWGESLRRSIDKGLSNAYFGVVILSHNFFSREWTQYELDGLLQKESSGRGAVLPIWFEISKEEIEAHSPSLANRLALKVPPVTIDQVVEELKQRVEELRPGDGEPATETNATS